MENISDQYLLYLLVCLFKLKIYIFPNFFLKQNKTKNKQTNKEQKQNKTKNKTKTKEKEKRKTGINSTLGLAVFLWLH